MSPSSDSGLHSSVGPDERWPLLSQQTASGQEDAMTNATAQHHSRDAKEDFSRRSMLLCSLPIILIVFIESSSILQSVPFNQVLEENICRRMYADSTRPNISQCGDDNAVQAELATLQGWQTTFDLIPTDKYGKKPVLILCVAGMSMASLFYTAVCFWPQQFPVRLTWVSPAFMLIGGGNAVLSSVVFSALSDLVPGPYRATTFFTLGAAVLVTELVVSPVASVLMQANLWLPIFLGIILFPVCILLVLCMEETKSPSVFSDQASPGLISADSSTGQNEEVERGHKHSNIWVRFCHGLERLKEGTVFFVAGNYRVAFLLSTLLTTTFGKTAQEMMLQFARRRFKWSWSEAGNLISHKAASTLVLLTILLPMANFFLVKKWAMRAIDKDLFLAKMSSMLLTVGNLVICVSATSAFFLFGKNKFPFRTLGV
ncbi:MFS transporter, putative [Metarhizium acridum CQMa 102]|uniref:MFS transporter, putative n=1 Tax=Metarhizium acridum (strain CQMa 102) TaxID=655827 RepID=E9DRE8_METAQ|nr:MFS transporter, putative [Metarhizium acridum CQMa 102]XP_007816184.1 MFS transporter, putative [Metarhizium acridum CQMa 102]EFY84113.1 MFS transporter, putative [Metarhizium acridum CQMa 102]EFY93826.1 MFS transporter, putative [Metarhizium acridum CQMa 102]